MAKHRIYIETTIPSFYFETRSTPAIIARRDWTREWWDAASLSTEIFTSVAVLRELQDGPEDKQQSWVSLVENLPLLDINDDILDIVDQYIKHLVMPQDAGGDAMHLAVASYYRCDFLVTWNCKHLANANKFNHIGKINRMLGLWTPTLTTPLELLENSDEHQAP